jgi:hypothetical protein
MRKITIIGLIWLVALIGVTLYVRSGEEDKGAGKSSPAPPTQTDPTPAPDPKVEVSERLGADGLPMGQVREESESVPENYIPQRVDIPNTLPWPDLAQVNNVAKIVAPAFLENDQSANIERYLTGSALTSWKTPVSELEADWMPAYEGIKSMNISETEDGRRFVYVTMQAKQRGSTINLMATLEFVPNKPLVTKINIEKAY